MSETYLNRIREARNKAAVLKAKVFSLRSGEKTVPILIFEGKSDVGAYSSWIKQIDNSFEYKALPGEGKAQLLSFREQIKDSADKNLNLIYFFIDHDYDGYRGYSPSENIFCLDCYSFENYLVTEKVLSEILVDELECAAERADVDRAINLFRTVLKQFSSAMKDANFKIYLAAKLDLKRGRLEKKINKFVDIRIDEVVKLYTPEKLEELVPILDDVNEAVEAQARETFKEIDNPEKSYRGKYYLEFFFIWLEKLAESRKDGEMPFSSAANIKFNRAMLTARSLAIRSDIPLGLSEHILNISRESAI